MKYRDLILYAISFLALTLFLLTPLAAEPSVLVDYPGAAFCEQLLNRAEQLVISHY